MQLKRMFTDPLLILALGLLASTLYAYFSGLFPYPFGWLILIVMIVARLHYLHRT